MKKKSYELVIRGQKVTLRDLQSIMPNSKALVVSKLLYYLATNKFIVFGGGGAPYVRRSLQEWVDDLELWFTNGSKRKISRSAVCVAFKDLVNEGIVTYINDNSRIRAYSIFESALIGKLSEIVGFEFDSYSEYPDDYICELEQICTKNVHSLNESEQYCTQNVLNLNETGRKLNVQSPDTQGFDGISCQATLTDTIHLQNNKSYKSEDSDFKSKNNFQNNQKSNSLNLQQNEQTKNIGAVAKHVIPQMKSAELKQKSTIVQNMFNVWQEEFPLLDEKLNIQKSQWLKRAHDSVFSGNLEEFKTYLKQVKASQFITEKPHLLTLKWLLDFNNLADIRSGKYASQNIKERAFEANIKIKYLKENDICKQVRYEILEQLGCFLYSRWFWNLSLKLEEHDKIQCLDCESKIDQKATDYVNHIYQVMLVAGYLPTLTNVNAESNSHFAKEQNNEESACNNQNNELQLEELSTMKVNQEVAKKMIEIWNRELPIASENLTDKKAVVLNEAFENRFSCSYDQFVKYLNTVKKTLISRTRPYLLSILWILDCDTICKMRDGFYEFA